MDMLESEPSREPLSFGVRRTEDDAPARPPRVLVVEDEPAIARDLLRRVRALGYPASTACGSAEEALAEASRVPPDVVLMDVSLSGPLDGVDVALALRARMDVPVVFVSAFADEAFARRAAQASAYGYLAKPVRDEALVVSLALAIARHRSDVEARVFEAAVQGATVGIALVAVRGAERSIERVNDAFCAMTGMPREAILGNAPCFLASDPTQPAVQRLRDAVRDLGHAEEVVRGEDRTGRAFWTLVTVSPVSAPSGACTHMLVFHKDVTQQRAAEQALTEAQRFETIGQLAAGVAHDFNNVLTAIVAAADFARGAATDAAQAQDLDDVLDAARRGGLLTRRLMDFARGGSNTRGSADLVESIAAAWPMAKRLAGPQVRCSLALPPPHVAAQVALDPTAVEQVLMNLVANARDAMGGEGDLAVSVQVTGAEATLEVRDSGSGMTDAVRQRIFEPLFSTKPRGLGTGIGLPSTQMLVRHAGGRIDVESAPGQGALFRVTLPLRDAPPRVTRTPPLRGRDAGGARCLVAVIEPALRGACVRALGAAGFETYEAGSAEAAARVLRALGPTLKLVICEEIMRRDGAPREATRAARVVILDEDRASEHEQEGASTLRKPFEMKALVEAALSSLDGG